MSDVRPVCFCEGLEALCVAGLEGRAELALWCRGAEPEIRKAFEGLDFAGFEDFRMDGPAGAIRTGLDTFLDGLSWPGAVRECIAQDISAMLGPMRSLVADYTLRLEYVTDDACRKFHKDETDFRLITTYLGRGTQWTTGSGEIQEMDTFHAGMLLGQRCAFPGRTLHRSPPIEGTGEVRLVLVLDVERPGYC